MFGLGMLLCAGLWLINLQEYRLMGDVRRNLPVANEQIEALQRSEGLLRLIWIPSYLAMAIAFLTWIHRAHRNLPSLGAQDLEFSPRGAVGWYFFPFLNLFKPYQVMREISNASDSRYLAVSGSAWRGQNATTSVRLWWASFLVANVLSSAAGRAEEFADTPGAFQFVAGASMVGYGLTMIAAALAARVIWLIDRRQSVRAGALGLN